MFILLCLLWATLKNFLMKFILWHFKIFFPSLALCLTSSTICSDLPFTSGITSSNVSLSFLICDTIHVSRSSLHILLLLITSPVVFLSIYFLFMSYGRVILSSLDDDFSIIHPQSPTEQSNLTYYSAPFKENYQKSQKGDHVQPTVQKTSSLGQSKGPASENMQNVLVWTWGKEN